jgi:hypothetical protein
VLKSTQYCSFSVAVGGGNENNAALSSMEVEINLSLFVLKHKCFSNTFLTNYMSAPNCRLMSHFQVYKNGVWSIVASKFIALTKACHCAVRIRYFLLLNIEKFGSNSLLTFYLHTVH